MNAHDATELAVIAGVVTVAALAIGAGALWLLRRRSLGVQIAALTASTVIAVLLGAYTASRKMFISDHDLTALVVVLIAAGTVAIIISLMLGARIGAASKTLTMTARQMGDDDGTPPTRLNRNAPAELSRLADELAVTQSRLNEARARERTLEGSRRELVAWVSHDLRTPLAGMRAIVEALQDRMVDDPATVAEYLATLGEEVNRLALLVDDLFELSRTQAGALRLRFERVSLDDLVADAIAGSAPVAAAKNVRLEGRMMGTPPALQVSSPELVRALRNLLENAIRHTPSDGSVVVEAGIDDAQPSWAYVSVSDSGGGVPEADLPRIFDVGYQHDPARSPGSGAGLGLAIAKGFVEAHRGDVTVVNENGGARFTVRLPLEPV